jgi:hypothetical protein
VRHTATGAVLDAGALIALDRGSPKTTELLIYLAKHRADALVPASALAQTLRSHKQVALHRTLKLPFVHEVALTPAHARAIGVLLAATSTNDVVDAHVALLAIEHDYTIVTSDPDDLRRLAPGCRIAAL